MAKKTYLLPSQRPSPLPNLRAYLAFLARKPNANRAVLESYCKASLAQMRRDRFFVGKLFGYKVYTKSNKLAYTVVWIDPYNYDCLVLNHQRRIVEFKNLYGLLL
ncbi:hypothetical protein MPK67_gp302 [Erwinia phage pEa_SNUABM_32]|uniref:Uncharacterized protein n=1 Tax=Erwinia phage pEa_SNUABM_32 TaxID=2869555 RepID=A0AAE8BZH2_9CAUD|nr:hypothetical protein MPK67_gp302 [Erwinia phage pEa_SNUABM_32]QZE57175.1 hypothetical protein pEaSNUABM32_00302 [Erwinia phage pEa_SNUABM_32]